MAQIVLLRAGKRVHRGLDERLVRLARRGLIRRGTGGLPGWFGRRPVRLRGTVLRDLVEEHKDGW